MTTPFDLAVVIPANNEQAWIGPCLDAVLASCGPARAQVIVVANGCTDRTVEISQDRIDAFSARDWRLEVLVLAEGSKIAALNAGDARAQAPVTLYLDADVVVDTEVFQQLSARLNVPAAGYGSGSLRIVTPTSAVSRAYLRIYRMVPFIAQGVPGCGLFAVNTAGRARWQAWPKVISDDTFARLNFSAAERHVVAGRYDWPLVEGWDALVRVRRRQNAGVAEIHQKFPTLAANDEKPPVRLWEKLRMMLRDPLGFAVYAGVALTTRLGNKTEWSRGR